MEQFKLLRYTGIVGSLAGLFLILFGGIKTTANFRIVSDLLQNIFLLNFVMLLFLPSEKTMKISLMMGIFNMVVDFFLETVAVLLDWWYPLGGTQFPPVIIVPLEMVVSFLIIGTSTGILLTFPEKFRATNNKLIGWTKPLFKNERYDVVWRVLYLFLISLVGTNGDYSAGEEIWMPGVNWLPIYTFFVWFLGGLLMLLFYTLLEKRIKREE